MGRGKLRARVQPQNGNSRRRVLGPLRRWWNRRAARWQKRLIAVSAVATALAAIVGLLINLGSLTGMVGGLVGPIIHPTPSPAPLARDGEDPNSTTCLKDAVVTVEAQVFRPDGGHFGTLELRYSRKCHAGWGRLQVLQADQRNLPPLKVEIDTRALPDHRVAAFTYPYQGEPNVYGNLLLARNGCVFAEVRITQGGMDGPLARTACANDNGYSRPPPSP
jgi:hypothetical protein